MGDVSNFLGTQWLSLPYCLNSTAVSEFPVHGHPHTVKTLAITLGAICQALAKNASTSKTPIYISNLPERAVLTPSRRCSAKRRDEGATLPFYYFSKYFLIYLRKFNFTPLLIKQDILNSVSLGICQFIYFYNVRNVNGIWLC